MAGLNRVVLVGRITKDPVKKVTLSGSTVTSFTVAVDNVPSKNGDRSASFIPCTCWNKTAENVAAFCTKGSLVGVDGRLNQRSYDDKDGKKHNIIEVIADSVQFLSSKNERKGKTDSGNGDYDSYPPSDNGSEDSSVTHEGIDSSDDDMPF